MTFKKIQLVVDNPSAVYYSGQLVTGRALVTCSKDKSLESITLHCFGEANVYWFELQGKTEGKKMVHYQSHESYFNQNFLLLGHGRKFYMKNGSHIFPFKFKLPHSIPSSFHGEHGMIRYKLKCTINRGRRTNPETVLDIYVISLFNLNIVTNARKSVIVNRCRQVPGCSDVENGNVNVCITMRKAGYVPGETIYVNADIRNCSMRVLKKIALQLVSIETYRTKLKTTVTRKLLSVTRYENCRVHSGHYLNWSDICLVIPQRLPPTGLPCCRVIDVRYAVELTFKPSGTSVEMKFPVEVILGTIPLKQRTAMRRSRTYEKLTASNEDLFRNPCVPSGRPRSKSISCKPVMAEEGIGRIARGSCNNPTFAITPSTNRQLSRSELDIHKQSCGSSMKQPSRSKSSHSLHTLASTNQPQRFRPRDRVMGSSDHVHLPGRSDESSSSASDYNDVFLQRPHGKLCRLAHRKNIPSANTTQANHIRSQYCGLDPKIDQIKENKDEDGYMALDDHLSGVENDYASLKRILDQESWSENAFSKLLIS